MDTIAHELARRSAAGDEQDGDAPLDSQLPATILWTRMERTMRRRRLHASICSGRFQSPARRASTASSARPWWGKRERGGTAGGRVRREGAEERLRGILSPPQRRGEGGPGAVHVGVPGWPWSVSASTCRGISGWGKRGQQEGSDPVAEEQGRAGAASCFP